MNEKAIWGCKIGWADRITMPDGADLPMRLIVEEEFYKLTGKYNEFCFSGWGEKLTEMELATEEDRPPKISNITIEIIELLETFSSGYSNNHIDDIKQIINKLKHIALVEKLNGE